MRVTDDLGRQVYLDRPIERIIPLAPSITEVVHAAGAGNRIIAVSHADDYPPFVTELPRFNSFPMDYEALVRLDPDAVIGTDQINNPRDARLFESLDLPVLYFSFDTWSDVPRVIRHLGTITENPDEAGEIADSLDAIVSQLRQQTHVQGERPDVLLLIGSEQLFSFGKNSYVHELIEIAGGVSVTKSIDTPAPVLTEEFVLTSQPDIIAGTFENPSELVENHPSFASLPAVVNDHICSLEPSIILRPGPRLVDGMEALASCIRQAKAAPATGKLPDDPASIPGIASHAVPHR